MMRFREFCELAACGAAVGGAAVWALAAAARVGWLRVILDLYPRSSWDRVTWVLIPVLLMLPFIAQGTVVAWASSLRPIPAGRGIAGSVAGGLGILVVASVAILIVVPRLSAVVVGTLVRVLPVPLILGCGALGIAWGLAAAGRAFDRRWVSRAAFPAALAMAIAAWLLARGWVLGASYVLDRGEVMAYFVAVAFGGGGASAWIVRTGARELTGFPSGRYNVRS
jgi:hypothetical protein